MLIMVSKELFFLFIQKSINNGKDSGIKWGDLASDNGSFKKLMGWMIFKWQQNLIRTSKCSMCAIAYTVGVPNGAIGQAIDGCGANQ